MHTWPGASWYCYCNTSVEKIFMLVFWQIQISILTWYWYHTTQQNRRTRVEVSQSSSDEQARSQLWQKGPIPNFCVKATFESATKLFWAARQQRTCFGLKGHFHPYISNISKWFCFKLESKICKLLLDRHHIAGHWNCVSWSVRNKVRSDKFGSSRSTQSTESKT